MLSHDPAGKHPRAVCRPLKTFSSREVAQAQQQQQARLAGCQQLQLQQPRCPYWQLSGWALLTAHEWWAWPSWTRPPGGDRTGLFQRNAAVCTITALVARPPPSTLQSRYCIVMTWFQTDYPSLPSVCMHLCKRDDMRSKADCPKRSPPSAIPTSCKLVRPDPV